MQFASHQNAESNVRVSLPAILHPLARPSQMLEGTKSGGAKTRNGLTFKHYALKKNYIKSWQCVPSNLKFTDVCGGEFEEFLGEHEELDVEMSLWF